MIVRLPSGFIEPCQPSKVARPLISWTQSWVKGQSGNPAGRPIGSRSKFSEAMVSDFLADWHEHGPDVLARVRATDPATYLRVAAVLVPKEMNVAVEQKSAAGNLQPEAWASIRRILDIIEASKVEGDPQTVFAMIEEDLRARMAVPVAKPRNFIAGEYAKPVE